MKSIFSRLRPKEKDRGISSSSYSEKENEINQRQSYYGGDTKPTMTRRFSKQEGKEGKGGFAEWAGTLSRGQKKDPGSRNLRPEDAESTSAMSPVSPIFSTNLDRMSLGSPVTDNIEGGRSTTPFSMEPLHMDSPVLSMDQNPVDSEEYMQMIQATAEGNQPIKRVAFISPIRTPVASIALDSIAWDTAPLPVPAKDEGSANGAEIKQNAMIRARNVFKSKDKLRDTETETPPHLPVERESNSTNRTASATISKLNKSSNPPDNRSTTSQQSHIPRLTSHLSHKRAETDPSAPLLSHLNSSTARSTTPSLKSPIAPVARARARTGGDLVGKRFCEVRQSWSEITEDDLVRNLSPRERTRQEVLWEIVSSEDRYVTDLCRLKEIFIDALLPPSQDEPPVIPLLTSARSDSIASMNSFQGLGLHRAKSPSYSSTTSPSSTTEDFDNLPIAARYASPSLGSSRDFSGGSMRQRGGSMDTTVSSMEGPEGNDETIRIKPNGRYSAALSKGRPSNQGTFSKNARSHHSLPPLPKGVDYASPGMKSPALNAKQTGRHSVLPESRGSQDASGSSVYHFGGTMRQKGHKLRKRMGSDSHNVNEIDPAPVVLPEELRIMLETLGSGILDGHIALADQLRKRYDDEYPLVRSLTDIFIANSAVLNQYTTYVLHLEKALQQIESAILAAETAPKRSQKGLDMQQVHLGQYLLSLEEQAADQGETGFIISISKPFQRLLKYPLLFQNLLFHTDATSHEYDGTMTMLEQVDSIVRRIEDEKSSQEQRIKTRDALARIDGLDNDKLLAVPKATRTYVQEYKYTPPTTVPNSPSRNSIRRRSKDEGTQRRSLKRLSDLMRGDEKETWVVVFSDVSLVCHKMGSTSLPIGHHSPSSDGNKKGKYNTIGRRSRQILPRNMYRFNRVLEWHVTGDAVFSNGMTDMQDIGQSRSASLAMSMRSGIGPPSSRESIQEGDESLGNNNDEYVESNADLDETRFETEAENDSDNSEGDMSLVFGNPSNARPLSMDGADTARMRKSRREGRFSLGPSVITGNTPAQQRVLVSSTTSHTEMTKRTIKKTGSGANGATRERANKNATVSSHERATSRISTRLPQPTHSNLQDGKKGSTGPRMDTNRQQAKFAGRLRGSHDQRNQDEGEALQFTGSSRISSPETTMPGIRPSKTGPISRNERYEKGKGLVVPRAPGGRI